MIVTNNPDIYKKCLMLRDYGREGRYEHKIKGYNSRLDTVQAVILEAKLRYLDEWNRKRHEHAASYGQLLKQTNGKVIAPPIKKDRTHVFQTFAVRLKNRDKVCERMKAKGVDVLVHYPIPLHLQEAYRDLNYKHGDFPVSELIADEILSLPMFPHMTQQQIEYVCAALTDAVLR
jgi:dTDP-4-amino-4,6-dideoxygalactose transaminase